MKCTTSGRTCSSQTQLKPLTLDSPKNTQRTPSSLAPERREAGRAENMSQEHPAKRQRLDFDSERDVGDRDQTVQPEPISPPPLSRNKHAHVSKTPLEAEAVASPIHLTSIRDLPDANNKDALSLHDLIGDPLIKEIWNFNYLHDIDFVMYSTD